MTQTLRFLTETPAERSPLLPLPRDILSDVLQIIRFSGAIDLRTEFSAPWTIETLPCADFAAALQCPTKHIIPFHIVAKGNCWVKATNGICKELAPGDIIIFPHGDAHILGDRLDREPVTIDRLLPAPPWHEPPILKYGGGGEMTQLVGFPDVCWYSWSKQVESMRQLLNYSFEWVLPGHGRRYHADATKMQEKMQQCVAWMESIKR